MQFEISNYRIEESIGEGGMAVVYRALQKSLERPVALKILNPMHSNTPEFTRRFLNEGRIIASLNHSNVVTIHDIGVENGLHFIAMEYLPGGDLRHRIRNGLGVEQALDHLETIANALNVAHHKHIVHRDVKPANVLFRADGTLVLSDFGIAKRLGSEDITLTGSTIGSPHYLSPEQARGRAVDARADIYSLGIMLYEMLTGRKPYRGASDIDTVLMHVNSPAPRLPAHLGLLQPLIDHTTAKDPADRYAETATLIAALRQTRAAWLEQEAWRAATPGREVDEHDERTQTLDLSCHSAPTHTGADGFHDARTVPGETAGERAGRTSAMDSPVDTGDEEPRPAATDRDAFQEADTLVRTGDAVTAPADQDKRPSRRLPIHALAGGGGVALLLGAALLIDFSPGPVPAPTQVAGSTSANDGDAASDDAVSRASPVDAAPVPYAAPVPEAAPVPDVASVPEQSPQAADAASIEESASGARLAPPVGATPGAGQDAIAGEGSAARVSAEDRARVDALLADAERALEDLRLTRPAGDNAWEYARQAQVLDPQDPRVQEVIDDLLARYVGLAERSAAAADYPRARDYVERGLEVAPDNEQLIALRHSLADRQPAPAPAPVSDTERRTTPMGVQGESPRELLDRVKGLFD